MGKIHDVASFKIDKFNERYRISTLGFLVQQFYNGVRNEFDNEKQRIEKFLAYMGKYEIPMKYYKKFVDNEVQGFHNLSDKLKLAGIPRTRKLILEYIYNYWNKDDDSLEEINDLEMSVQNIDETNNTGVDQFIYMPHPLDGLFVIDSSSPLRKLDLLESRIDQTLQKSPIKPGNQHETSSKPLESFASAVSSTPKANRGVIH